MGQFWPAMCIVMLLVLCTVLPGFPAEGISGAAAGVPPAREAADAPWPAFHADASRTGNASGYGPGTSHLLWSNSTGANCYGSPAVAGGRVFIGSTAGNMYCFNATTGERLWSHATGGNIHSTPWVDIGADRIYFGSHDNYVYCLNASSGSQVWRTQLGGVVTSSPLLDGGMLYVGCGDWYYGSEDGYLYCLYASNGTQAWRTANAGGAASPALSDGRLFSAGGNNLVCLDPGTGTILWSNATGTTGFCSPSAADGRVFIANFAGDILCFNASTGERLWLTDPGCSESSSTPAIYNGSVYVCVDNGSFNPGALVKLDAATGTVTWMCAVQGAPWSSPAVAGGRVYLAWDRTVVCVDDSDHSQLWSYQGAAGDQYGIGGSPAIAYGRLYIGGAESKLYCFGFAGPNAPPAAVTLQPPTEVRESSLVLKWSRSADGDFARYEVHRSLLPGFIPSQLTLVTPNGNIANADTLTVNVSNLNYSTKYYFKIRVWDGGDPPMFNDSNEIEATTATPNGAPAAVTLYPAEDIGPFSVRLAWSVSADWDFARYEVHRGTMKAFLPVPSTLAATISDADQNSTTVPDLKPWTAYFFKVRVYDNGTPALRNDSNEVEVRTGNTPPFAVTLDQPQMGATSADLSWSASADDDFASYEVHCSQNGSFLPSNQTLAGAIQSRLTTEFGITGLQLARTYHFIVRVIDQGGMSNDSNIISGLTANTLPRPVISSPSDGDVFDTRTPVDFNGSGSSDQDLDPLSFHWTSSVDGFLSSNATFTRLLSEGGHRITLFVDDGHGHNVSARVTITVNKAPNRRPAVTVVVPADNSQVFGVVTFSGTAADIDGNDTLSAVQVKIGKADWDDADGLGEWTYSWNTTKVQNGKVKVLIRSYDGDLYSPEAALGLTVNNVAVNLKPAVAIDPPRSTRLSGNAVVSGTASDADGTVSSVELSIDGGPWQRVLGTGVWSYTIDSKQLRNGAHSLKARAYDGTDYSDTASLDFTVGNALGIHGPGRHAPGSHRGRHGDRGHRCARPCSPQTQARLSKHIPAGYHRGGIERRCVFHRPPAGSSSTSGTMSSNLLRRISFR
jgi:outer membrane protein assembly factor BamB